MFKLHQRVKLVRPATRKDMEGAVGTIVGIWFTEPVWYHIQYDGFTGRHRSTADQLEPVDERL